MPLRQMLGVSPSAHQPMNSEVATTCDRAIMRRHTNLSWNPAQATVFVTGGDFAKSLSPEMNSCFPCQLLSDKVVITCKGTWSCSFPLLGPLTNTWQEGMLMKRVTALGNSHPEGAHLQNAVNFSLAGNRIHWLGIVLPTTRENSWGAKLISPPAFKWKKEQGRTASYSANDNPPAVDSVSHWRWRKGTWWITEAQFSSLGKTFPSSFICLKQDVCN